MYSHIGLTTLTTYIGDYEAHKNIQLISQNQSRIRDSQASQRLERIRVDQGYVERATVRINGESTPRVFTQFLTSPYPEIADSTKLIVF